MGSLGGGAPSLPLITQNSIEKLVSAHGARESKMPAKEWLELLLPNTAANAAGGANAVGGILPTLSAMRALEASAAAMETDAVPPPAGRGGKKAPRTSTKPPTKPATTGRGRKRAATDEDDASKPVINLPPKKKGRKKKGEVDTETEEEKALRAEERQRKIARAPRVRIAKKARMVARARTARRDGGGAGGVARDGGGEAEARSGCVEGRRGGDQEDVLDQMRDLEDGRGGDSERTSSAAIWNGRAFDECDRGVFGRTASNRPLVHKVLRHLRLLQ